MTKISIGQISVTNDKAENLEAMGNAAAAAARGGSSLVVFPEMAMWFDKPFGTKFWAAAEAIPGPFSTAIDALAAKHSIAIAVGMLETTTGDPRPYNTIYITSAEGKTIGTYRKAHLYDAFGLRESEFIARPKAAAPMVFELAGITFGVMTCYDLRFPESARLLVDGGAEVLLLPSLWTPGVRKEDHWDTLVRARAIENTSFVVAANVAAPVSTGASMIVDPMGIVLAQMVEGPETRTVEISSERVSAVRATNPCLANRRFRVVHADSE